MISKRPYIIYTLPKSKTTQALTGGKIEQVWGKVKYFLTNCTTADINKTDSIYLNGYSADEIHGELPLPADEILAKTKAVFGEGETSPIGFLYPQNIPLKQTKTVWTLTNNDLMKAINFLVSGQPYPKYNLGPIELIISYSFKLIDPVSKIELPNQQFTSSILLWLTKNNCVSPSLCFPFKEPNKEFWDYANSIEKFIPFNFHQKYLRLGRSNKKGTLNTFSKL